MKSYLFPFAALFSSATAHTIFQELWVNGVSAGHEVGIRVPSYDGPITDVTSNDVICNGGPNPLNTPYPTTIINVPAGAQVTTEWHHTLAGLTPGDSADPIDPSHLALRKQPVMAYMAKVPSALQTSVTGLGWFKVYQDGYSGGTGGTWATSTLIKNKGKVSFTIPSCIPPGNYFLRAEIIALHAASSYPGAQLYMECAQINVTGGGSTNPATVSFPGAYHNTDPGITFNLYNPPPTSYTIPGPAVFSCSGGGGGGGGNPTTAHTTAVQTTPRTTTTTAAGGGGGGTAAHYAQCGGIGYTGPTVCAAGYTCTYSSAYYSQCL